MIPTRGFLPEMCVIAKTFGRLASCENYYLSSSFSL